MELTGREYWESIYDQRHMRGGRPEMARPPSRIGRILGPKMREYLQDYTEHLRWDVIYRKYMPRQRGLKALEVGSAPGDFLVKLNRVFGFESYGVEYSQNGAELNRRVFLSHNISPANVIQKDFLSDEFQEEYQGRFNIVISRGFLEHFTDPVDVIQKHLNVLADSGYLVVSIPNLRGINYLLMWFFNKETLPGHNLKIMKRHKFRRLFDESRLLTLFCDYFGTFNFGVFNTGRHSPKRFVLNLCGKLQLALNLAFRLALKDSGAESGLYVMFIGVKKNGAT